MVRRPFATMFAAVLCLVGTAACGTPPSTARMEVSQASNEQALYADGSRLASGNAPSSVT